MRIETQAIVCGLRTHGEHGAVARLMTPDHGLQAAYVRGARGRRMSPLLIAGNRVQATLASRSEGQLPQATLELTHSRAPLMAEPLPAAAIAWLAALTATALPEGQPYPNLYAALDAVFATIEAAPGASDWGAVLVRYELLLLAELGFGLDLESCAASGVSEELVAVSPRSGRAVSAAAAEPFADRLLPLPRFLQENVTADWSDIAAGLQLTGHFVLRDVLDDRSAPIVEARNRLIDRLARAGGFECPR